MWTNAARRDNALRSAREVTRAAARSEQARRAAERATHSRGPDIFQPTGSPFPDACAEHHAWPV